MGNLQLLFLHLLFALESMDTYLGFSSAVSDSIKQEVRLVVNPDLVSNETQAQAIAGINLDFTTSTLTISGSITPQDLYDYYRYQLAQSANMQYAEEFTKTGNHFDLVTGINCRGVTYNGDFTTGGTITLSNGGVVVGTSIDQNGTMVLLPWSVDNVEVTTTLQLYNVTQSLEIENIIVGGTAGSKVTASGYYDETEVVWVITFVCVLPAKLESCILAI